MIAKIMGAVREAGKFPAVFQKKMALTAVIFGATILSGSVAYFWKTENIDAIIASFLIFFINCGVFFSGKCLEGACEQNGSSRSGRAESGSY